MPQDTRLSGLYLAGAALLGAIGAYLVGRWGGRLGFFDHPSRRSSHHDLTPRAGGIGIVVVGIAAAISSGWPVIVWLPMAGIGVLGLTDDRWHVEPFLRLLVQCTLAGLTTQWLLRSTSVSAVNVVAVGILFVLILVGTTNVYNFMDGANGMAGLMGVVVFGTLAVVALTIANNVDIGRVALATAAGCCGFLSLNLRRRARVFMGDVCSTFLGFTATLLALKLLIQQPIWGLCALGSMTVFYVDAGWTLLTRLHRRERLFEAHRTHADQRLVNELGWAQPVAAFAYAGVQSTVSLLVLVSSRWGCRAVVGVLTGVTIALSCLYWYVQEKASRSV